MHLSLVTFYFRMTCCLFLHILIEEGGSTLSTVVTIVVLGHEASNASHGAVLAKTDDLATILNSVVLKSLEGDGLRRTLSLLGLGVDLLLTLLSSSTETEHKMKSRLLLDVIIRESASILKLLSSKNQTLLIRGDSFLILDLGFDIIDGVRRLNIERDGLACCDPINSYLSRRTNHSTRCIPDDRQSIDRIRDQTLHNTTGRWL
jgi:hypothetical protein